MKTNIFTAKIEVEILMEDREDMDLKEQKLLAVIEANEIKRLLNKLKYETRIKSVEYEPKIKN